MHRKEDGTMIQVNVDLDDYMKLKETVLNEVNVVKASCKQGAFFISFLKSK